MKKIYLLAIAVITAAGAIKAQTPCTSGRYAADTFTSITTNSGIAYGSNTTISGSTQILTMDVYQPAGDVEPNRPLIIWAHGGSFIGGSSTDGDVVKLSQSFAKKGFVCVSINYRLGFFPFDSVNAVKAVLRAVQDMKASIRFFYKDKLTLNAYKIDTNNIFIGGSSAGAVTALHTVYLNKSCEINPYVAPSTLASLGGMDGYSGNQCYSSKVKGVINLCGGIGNYGWIEAGDLPFCSMHGTIDGTVNYSRGKAISLVYLDGSRMLKQQANVLGISNPFYTWYGQDHVPYAASTPYMDTTISFVRDYLISRLGCTNPPLLLQNTPSGTATLTAYTGCTTNIVPSCAVGIFESANEIISFDIFPNPSNSDVTISFENQSTSYKIELFDLSGKLILSNITTQNTFHIYKNTLNSGVYFVKITNNEGKYSVKKLLLNY
jgi:hypothetical protein